MLFPLVAASPLLEHFKSKFKAPPPKTPYELDKASLEKAIHDSHDAFHEVHSNKLTTLNMAHEFAELGMRVPEIEYRPRMQYNLNFENPQRTIEVHKYYEAAKVMDTKVGELRRHHQEARNLHSRLKGQSDGLEKTAADHKKILGRLVRMSQDHIHEQKIGKKEYEAKISTDLVKVKALGTTRDKLLEDLNSTPSASTSASDPRTEKEKEKEREKVKEKEKDHKSKDKGHHSLKPWPYFTKGEGSG